MSHRSLHGVRKHVLAAATIAAISATAIAAPAFAAGEGRVYTAGLQTAATHDRFIVKYREGSSEAVSAAALQHSLAVAARGTLRGKALGLRRLRSMATGADVLVTRQNLSDQDALALMRQIAADPSVVYVEIDRLLKPTLTPNDTYYNDYQWHYYEAAGGIKADEAWDITDGSGSVVAVIDTGITAHSDLDANILPGYDFISDAGMARDGNGRDSDPQDEGDWYGAGECGAPGSANSSWHGTHVAGTVAAITNNNSGVAGVAYGAEVVPVRVLGKCGGYTSDIVDAIVWASGGSVSGVPANANPADVINMSLGGTGSCSASTQSAINGAVGRGTTVVVAAGNANENVSNHNPGNCANVISVASTTRTGARSSFSNYGSLIDVAAPGSSIASTINTGATTPSTEGYAIYSGTSMSSPHVAGVVALMQSVAGGTLTPAEVESTLKNTLRAFPVSIDKDIGDGIVNAKAAVDAVVGGGTGGGGGGGGAPCTGCTPYAGSLSGNGDSDVQPNGTYYYSASGTHQGWLEGPAGTDFDLRLYKWTGRRWNEVDNSLSSGSSESVSYSGGTGYYYWRIESYSGSGSYDFWLTTP